MTVKIDVILKNVLYHQDMKQIHLVMNLIEYNFGEILNFLGI